MDGQFYLTKQLASLWHRQYRNNLPHSHEPGIAGFTKKSFCPTSTESSCSFLTSPFLPSPNLVIPSYTKKVTLAHFHNWAGLCQWHFNPSTISLNKQNMSWLLSSWMPPPYCLLFFFFFFHKCLNLHYSAHYIGQGNVWQVKKLRPRQMQGITQGHQSVAEQNRTRDLTPWRFFSRGCTSAQARIRYLYDYLQVRPLYVCVWRQFSLSQPHPFILPPFFFHVKFCTSRLWLFSGNPDKLDTRWVGRWVGKYSSRRRGNRFDHANFPTWKLLLQMIRASSEAESSLGIGEGGEGEKHQIISDFSFLFPGKVCI